MYTSWGELILRVVVGLLLAGHGAQKLFGWFGGNGFTKTTGFMKSMGFTPAWLWTLLGGAGEFGGGLLLALGLLTPLGAIAVFASMLMAAIRFHWSNGLWGTNHGYEYPMVLLFVSFVLGLIGPGDYSLDAVIGFALPTMLLFWIGLALASIIVAIGIVTSTRRAAQTQTVAQ